MFRYLLYFRFVTYLSAICDNAAEGKKLLNTAINALFSMPVPGESNGGTDVLHEHTEEKPCLLWSALYIQELTVVCFLPFTFSSAVSLTELSFLVHLLPIQPMLQFSSLFLP